MSSSEAPKTRSSRRFIWLAAFILVLFGGYSAAWYFMAGKVTERVDATLARLNTDGRTAICENSAVGGFPFRLGLTCDSVAYEDTPNRIAVTAGGLRTAAQIYQPLKTVAELDGPLRMQAPGLVQLFIEWDSLVASARLARPIPSLVSVDARGLSGLTDPDDETDPVNLFSATEMQAHLRPNGADLDWAGSFKGLEIEPDAIDGVVLPVLDGEGDATVKNGVALIQSRPKSLRGQSVEIRTLALSSGEGRMTLSGPVTVDAGGLIDADLKLSIRNVPAVSAMFQKAVPESANQIKTAFSALAIMGEEPVVPLRIVKSRIMLAFITLGELPPVE